jgi:F-type H+-transporting ATPase subunit delta
LIRQSIAKRYAKGLFAAGEKDGRYRDYLEQLGEILSLVEKEPRIGKSLMVPLLEMDKRKMVLAELVKALGMAPTLAALLGLLLEKNRMGYLPSVLEAYGELINEKEGLVKGVGYSAYPLSPAAVQQIEEALGQRLNKKVQLHFTQDSSLIGGVKVVVGGVRIDGTVRRQFELLNESLMKE